MNCTTRIVTISRVASFVYNNHDNVRYYPPSLRTCSSESPNGSTIFLLREREPLHWYCHHPVWDSLRCLSRFPNLSRDSIISNLSAAIMSPLTWSMSVTHGTLGVGSRIVRRVRVNYIIRVHEQEHPTKRARKNFTLLLDPSG